MLEGVDDGGIAELRTARNVHSVTAVNVPVQKVFGAVFLQQLAKACETPVRQGVEVVDIPGGRVGHENVEAAIFQKL